MGSPGTVYHVAKLVWRREGRRRRREGTRRRGGERGGGKERV